MKYVMRVSSLFLLAFCVITHAANAKKPWTFLVYMAADNNLNPDADLNLQQMKQIGSNDNINILVYLNIKRPGQEKKTQKLFIKKGIAQQIGFTTSEDSGDENTLIKALAWAMEDYPSDHIAVGLWDHGSGPLNRVIHEHRGVCYDDTTGNYLTDLKYKHAFDTAIHQYRAGNPIDIIFFDACLMADIEVAYTLKADANYMVASQETVPGPGYNYTTVLAPFTSGSLTPVDFVHTMIASYNENYKSSNESYTLSAVNLATFFVVPNALNQMTTLLVQLLSKQADATLANALVNCTKAPACPHYTENTYIDLWNFYSNLYAVSDQVGLNSDDMAQLQALARKCMNSITKCVIGNVTSPDLSKSRGMSIYFPDISFGIEPSYYDLYWSASLPGWLNFIGQFAQPAQG